MMHVLGLSTFGVIAAVVVALTAIGIAAGAWMRGRGRLYPHAGAHAAGVVEDVAALRARTRPAGTAGWRIDAEGGWWYSATWLDDMEGER